MDFLPLHNRKVPGPGKFIECRNRAPRQTGGFCNFNEQINPSGIEQKAIYVNVIIATGVAIRCSPLIFRHSGETLERAMYLYITGCRDA
jgi:hypothetical protein